MKRDDLRAFLAEKPYDAMVLTSEISRRYATGFHSTAGAVYLSAKQAVFFTDFRYAEAARAAISDFEVREIKAGQSYSSLINGLIEEDGAKKVALEDKTLTYAEFMSWSTALHATAVRLEDGVESLRMMKEDTEVEKDRCGAAYRRAGARGGAERHQDRCDRKGDRRPPDLPHAALRRGKYVVRPDRCFRREQLQTARCAHRKRPSRQAISSRWTSAASMTATART